MRLSFLPYLAAPLTILVNPSSASFPAIHEAGKEITLFAEAPDIVTPIGMAIDENDAIYVIESHTHSPPSDYPGPKRDRIKRFLDSDGDGKADRVEIFAEGLNEAMNLAFAPDGTLYALCAKELVALPDRDGDGVCDALDVVLRLECESGNPHGNWLGLAFDNNGRAYLGRGNVGSHYHRVEGKDGSVVDGYGDGGSVIRVNADGSQVEPWATGFWNPMAFIFDRANRLMLVDNDPDGRGPNRLLEVVYGGDYGYKSVFGGWGRHPFQGWDGSLPGTLPFLSGTGEAPSGVIDASQGPHDSYLVTIWNENTIERHTASAAGAEKTIFMSGDKDFRPVALAYDSHGNLFITDWMLVAYPNHGEGRIWRVSNMSLPRKTSAVAKTRNPSRRSIRSVLANDDPFIRHSGEMWLSQRSQAGLARRLARDDDPFVRLGAILALRRSGDDGARAEIIRSLADSDDQVRRVALMWAGEQLDPDLRPYLDTALTAGPVDTVVFEAYLAAIEMLEPSFATAFRNRENKQAYKIPRSLDPEVLVELANDESLPSAARALAVERLEPEAIADYLQNTHAELRLAAVRKASLVNSESVRNALLSVALNEEEEPPIRAEALLGLSRQSLDDPSRLIPLLYHTDSRIAIEATRALRLRAGDAGVRNALERIRPAASNSPERAVQAEIAEFALFGFDASKPYGGKRPVDLESWQDAVSTGGDPDRGSRVFRSQQSLCITCHGPDGRGTEFGPSLMGVAQSLSREAIVQAILQPSDSFSPDYQAWIVKTKDGRSHQGVQIDHQRKGSMLLFTLNERRNVRFESEDIVDYEASQYSLMPPGLENTMTVSEFRDLVAYLTDTR